MSNQVYSNNQNKYYTSKLSNTYSLSIDVLVEPLSNFEIDYTDNVINDPDNSFINNIGGSMSPINDGIYSLLFMVGLSPDDSVDFYNIGITISLNGVIQCQSLNEYTINATGGKSRISLNLTKFLSKSDSIVADVINYKSSGNVKIDSEFTNFISQKII